LVLAALALGAVARGAQPEDPRQRALQAVTEAKLRAVIKKLSEGPPRLSGYPRSLELADWIERRFRQLGLRDVDTMPFYVTVPVQKYARLAVAGEAEPISLHAVWPNLVRTSTAPSGGIRGKLIYAADGHLHRFNGLDVRGNIVLLDFNSRGRWENAAILGAAACLFIGTDELATGELRNKYYDTPLDMPRFWVDPDDGGRLRRRFERQGPFEVTLWARVDWERRATKNVYGFVRGTDPQRRRDLLVVEAYTDSVSVIPTRAPGATQACSLAALLALADHFAAHPPQRSVLFLASSGHAQAVAGVRHFFDAFNTSISDLNKRVAEARKEVSRLEALREALTPPEELRHRAKQARAAADILRAKHAPPDETGELPPPVQAAVAEARRLEELVERLEKDGDPSAAFGQGVGKVKRDLPLAAVAASAVAVLLAAYALLRRSQDPLLARIVLAVLVLGLSLVALGGLVGREEATGEEQAGARVSGGAGAFAGALRNPLLLGASAGSAGVLLVALVLLRHDRLLRVARGAVIVAGVGFVLYSLLDAWRGWFMTALLTLPLVVLVVVGIAAGAPRKARGALSPSMGASERLVAARNLVVLLVVWLTLLLKATVWTAEWGVPGPLAPAIGVLCALVLLAPSVQVATARKLVMVPALGFVLLSMIGLTPHKEMVEEEVLREKMLERLHDPMRLEAEECAKQLFRLRTLRSPDTDSPSQGDEAASAKSATIERINELRRRYKQLSFRDNYPDLTESEEELFRPTLERARREVRERLRYGREQLEVLRGKLRLAARLVYHNTEELEEEKEGGIYLFVGLELSSKTAQVGAFREGWLYRLVPLRHITDTYSPLAERLVAIAREIEMRYDLARGERRPDVSYTTFYRHERIYRDVIRGKRGRHWHTYIPRLPFSSEVADLSGQPGITFATLGDERRRVDSPADTLEHLDVANVVTQTRLILLMLEAMAAEAQLVRLVEFPNRFGRVKGTLNMELSGRRTPDQPVPGAVAMLYRGMWQSLVGARRRIPQLSGPDGEFQFVGMANRPRAWWRRMTVDGYRLHPDTGEIVMAVNMAMNKKYPNNFANNDQSRSIRPVLFDCRAVPLYNLFDQRYFRQLFGLQVLDARRESNPIRFGYNKWWISGVVFLEPLVPLKVVMTERLRGVRLVLLNASREQPEGVGYTVEQLRREPLMPLLVARDFCHLVGHRLDVLEARGIRNRRLRELHEAALGFKEQAERALASKQYDVAIDAARSAWAYESRAYPDVQATIHDTVAGVLFYVALLLPFSYCIERLFFSFSRITSRAAATMGVLASALVILWHIHPAFELSNSPFIVILAFFLLGLGGLTLTIIVSRFEDEMKKLERERSGIKVADVSRASAFGAAFALGISNMRRRKIRTGLTAATLIILTFAIMSFTSTRTRPVEREQAIEAKPSYNGVLIRMKLWARMQGLVYSTLYDKYGQKGIVAPRVWRGPQRKGERSYIDIRSPDGRRKFTVKSLLGLSVDEHKLIKVAENSMLTAGRWFQSDTALEILLPRRVAQVLGVRESDVGKAKVKLFGIEFTVAGILDGRRFDEFLDLNGEPITPVDWSVEQEAAEQEREAAAERESETGVDARELQYVHVPADEMAVLPFGTLWSLGGSLRSVAVAFGPDISLADIRRHLKDRLTLTLYFGDEEGVYKFTAADVPSFQGLRNVAIPLVIAFLIVLNTMLGSVHERIREVGIYSSVGLAPGHISMLFMAEAVGLATVSAIAGYLISQSAVKALFTMGWMDTQHMFLNYSSTATVGSLLVVIGMVLASTAYPARMVSRVASPDIERRWSLPPPVGDRITLRLPYSLSRRDVPGLMLFLHRFIRAHEEASFGVFCVRDVELTAQDGRIRLAFSAWLAPYDLGVYQKVTITTQPAGEEGFDRATVQIDRQAGERASWRRNNKAFLNQIRKQLLVWRAIGPGGREKYIAEAREVFDLRFLIEEYGGEEGTNRKSEIENRK